MGDTTSKPMGALYGGYVKCASVMNVEAMDFVKHRMEEDLLLPQKMAACKTPLDVYNIQVAFYTRMVDDYVSESHKMLGLAQSAAQGDPDACSPECSHLSHVERAAAD